MQHDQQSFTEQESLRLISNTIYQAKGYYYESGMVALLYGFAILICSVSAYWVERSVVSLPLSPFYLLVPVFFVQAWLQAAENRKKKAKTFTDEAIDFVWLGFFLSTFAALCANFAGLGFISISIILVLMGLAAFLTGMLSRFTYHIVSGFACWLLAIVSFFALDGTVYLLLAAAAVIVWIIPGFILRAHFKKEHQKSSGEGQ